MDFDSTRRCRMCHEKLTRLDDFRCSSCAWIVCYRHWDYVRNMCLVCTICEPAYTRHYPRLAL